MCVTTQNPNIIWLMADDMGYGEPAGQLYRLDNDPSETRNLWDEEPEVRDRLLQRLQSTQEAPASRYSTLLTP